MPAVPAAITGAVDTTGFRAEPPFLLATEQYQTSIVGSWVAVTTLAPQCRVIRAVAASNPIKLSFGPAGPSPVITLGVNYPEYFIVPQNTDGTGLQLFCYGVTGVGTVGINAVT